MARVKSYTGPYGNKRKNTKISHGCASDGAAKGSVEFYLNDIKKIPMLTPKEEKILGEKIAEGSGCALEKMVIANLRLVVHCARRYAGRGLSIEDIIEEGNIGLIKAAERFEPSRGCRFSTYAIYWIRQSIERAIINQASVVRVPINVRNDVSRLRKTSREIEKVRQREPRTDEIADSMGVSEGYVKKLLMIARKSQSLDEPIAEDGQRVIETLQNEDSPSPVDLRIDAERKELIKECLDKLTDRERTILRQRFGLEGESMSLGKIGCELGLSRERIRQIESKALCDFRDLVEQAGASACDVL